MHLKITPKQFKQKRKKNMYEKNKNGIKKIQDKNRFITKSLRIAYLCLNLAPKSAKDHLGVYSLKA